MARPASPGRRPEAPIPRARIAVVGEIGVCRAGSDRHRRDVDERGATAGALRPVATNVALPPARRSTVVAIVPVPDGDVHLDPLLAVHVHVTPVNGAGNASVTEAPMQCWGHC
jgi:hypothetical protein